MPTIEEGQPEKPYRPSSGPPQCDADVIRLRGSLDRLAFVVASGRRGAIEDLDTDLPAMGWKKVARDRFLDVDGRTVIVTSTYRLQMQVSGVKVERIYLATATSGERAEIRDTLDSAAAAGAEIMELFKLQKSRRATR